MTEHSKHPGPSHSIPQTPQSALCVDPVKLTSIIVEAHRQVAARRLEEHRESWSRVEGWLQDEASKTAYRQELAFGLVNELLGPARAAWHSPLQPKQWEQALQLAQTAQSKGALPRIAGMSFENTHDLCTLISSFILDQYAYETVVRPEKGDVALDCGGCFGETAVWCRMFGADVVHSFEPNPATFAHLRDNALHFDPAGEWFSPVPLGLSDHEGSLPFLQREDHPGACAFDEQGNIQVPVTTIDAWCERNGVIPTFIKMDLEGAEPLAIRGAEKTFRVHKPKFAICLYHDQAHMWELPLLLKSYVPEYRLWCKKSSPIGEFVLFGRV